RGHIALHRQPLNAYLTGKFALKPCHAPVRNPSRLLLTISANHPQEEFQQYASIKVVALLSSIIGRVLATQALLLS
ncbi:MAG: hypothetical protein ACI8W1_002986, partial [Candidatus Azotimanducaceae bacterium]